MNWANPPDSNQREYENPPYIFLRLTLMTSSKRLISWYLEMTVIILGAAQNLNRGYAMNVCNENNKTERRHNQFKNMDNRLTMLLITSTALFRATKFTHIHICY